MSVYRWPRVVASSYLVHDMYMVYHRIFEMSNAMGDTSGVWTAYTSEGSEFAHSFNVVNHCSFCSITCLHVFSSVLWCQLRFLRKKKFSFVFTALVLYGVHIIIMLIVFIYTYWCTTRFKYQMMFKSFNSNSTGVTSGSVTANSIGTSDIIPGF